MAGFFKRLSMSETGQAALAWAAVQYLRIVKSTNRWELRCPPETEALLERGAPIVACFWHGRLAVMRAAWRDDPARFHMLISGHRDGEVIAVAMRKLGFPVISGSSRRGGSSALRAMCQVLWDGGSVGVTPDGPRGPRMRAKLGAIKAAQAAGVPIVPVTGAVARCKILKTWDRFMGADFFSRGVIRFGTPIIVPGDADRAVMEARRAELEESLNRLTREVDLACGLEPVEPAPPGPWKTSGKDAGGNGLSEPAPEPDETVGARPEALASPEAASPETASPGTASPDPEPGEGVDRLAGGAGHARP